MDLKSTEAVYRVDPSRNIRFYNWFLVNLFRIMPLYWEVLITKDFYSKLIEASRVILIPHEDTYGVVSYIAILDHFLIERYGLISLSFV